jgi:outer membrane protein assembly factor BamB
MFNTNSAFWYQFFTYTLIAFVILGPLALYFIWRTQRFETRVKSLISMALVALLGGSAFATRSVRNAYNQNEENRRHYAALEQSRAAQQQQTAANQPPASAAVNSNSAPTAPETSAPPTAKEQTTTSAAPAPPTQTAAPAAKPNQKTAAHATAPAREYWTDFRGPWRDGVYRETAINTNWGKGLTPVWKQPVGLGFASFVVGEGRAYTIEQRREQEVAAAYDLATGRELWANAWPGNFADSTGDGPRATPTYEGGRVYALGAEGELRALDAKTGKPLWNKNILSDNSAGNLSWGVSASPLIVDDKVVVMVGGSGGKSIVAYNKMNGGRVWSALNDGSSYTAPMLATLNGKRQILAVTGARLVGLAPENGALLWEFPWANSLKINVSQPLIVDANHVFMSAGYGKGAALVEISGNTARAVWENNNMKNKFNSSVLDNGYVYGLDEGILSCLDVRTGERKWKGGRYGYGQLLLAGGHLVVIAEDGRLALVKASPEAFTEVAQFQALEGKSWNVPTLSGGKLLIRNAKEMACFNLAAQ